MIRLRRALRLDALRDDRGMAMAISLIFGMVIVIMAATAISVATSGLRKADNDQSWNAALSAAYAGIEEYQARLSNDNSYFKYGDSNAPFSLASRSSLILPTGNQANKAFGFGTSGTWSTVAGSDGKAQFRYEVDSSLYASKGVLRLRSTGKVGKSIRSVIADIRQKGFIDYLYFTDYEIQDPLLSGKNSTMCSQTSAKHAWEGRVQSDGCGEIAFSGGDNIAGPAHSNDTLRVCQATFQEEVTTANPTSAAVTYTKRDSNDTACTGQNFVKGQPKQVKSLDLPVTLDKQKRETRSDLPDDVPLPGCLYTGPTDIVFTDDGKMTIKSPYTKKTRTSNEAATAGSTPAECGLPGTGANQLGSPGGATITVPANNLIYVQNIPLPPSGSAPADVNASAATGDLTDTSCSNNHVGYPIANEVAPPATVTDNRGNTTLVAGSTGKGTCAYSARAGDAFVKGTFRGQLTIATDNYLYVTGDLKYSTTDANTNILGLAPLSTAWVYNPVDASNNALLSKNREINAALLSVGHSFTVQNYARGGDRGTLTFKGSIGQKFRGIVRNGSNGYIKNYTYDTRLRFMAPPKFLSPVTTEYGVSTLSEVKAGYKVDGSSNP
ncbi:hypothetical protein ACPEEZ_02025 [Frigoribacterium sp. 2-23]|uniref:hypothetical protein n=1 Tax=Frigoribacterium sp. 2-23 TaxID=3415006 RepID=UPI003C6F3685